MDQEGQVVNIVSREYPLSFPHPGWSEQNPEDWWEQSKEGIKELISKIDATEVAGISFGGQMHGLVILDENDQVIRPAILWNDGRTTKETDYLNQVIEMCIRDRWRTGYRCFHTGKTAEPEHQSDRCGTGRSKLSAGFSG